MFKNFKKHARNFIKYPPGKRFEHYYAAVNRRIKKNVFAKVMLMMLGVLSFLVGFVLLFIPGPGLLFIGIACVLFCLCTRKLAVFFDRTEMKIRHWHARKKKRAR